MPPHPEFRSISLDAMRSGLLALVDGFRRDEIDSIQARHLASMRYPLLGDAEDASSRALHARAVTPCSSEELRSLVTSGTKALQRNPYFVEWVDGHLTTAYAFDTSRMHKWRDALVYAALLERVTGFCLESGDHLEALLAHLARVRRTLNWRRHSPPFLTLKLHSVVPAMHAFAKAMREGHIDPSFGRWTVAVNILEAVVADGLGGLRGNAALGWSLAKTLHTEAYMLADGVSVGLRFPDEKRWADLYQIWNLCFVLRFPECHIVIPKLLIPSVADYAEAPGTYMQRRSIALVQQVHFAAFRRADRLPLIEPVQCSAALRRAFDRFNRRHARSFAG